MGLRLLLLVSLVLSAAAGVSVAAQQPAMATTTCAGIPAFPPPNLSFRAKGPCNAIPVAHGCTIIGTLSNGNQAGICADIYTSYDTTRFDIWGAGEYFCQGPAVQCKGIHASNTLVITLSADADFFDYPEPSNPMRSTSYQCSTTSCPNGVHAVLSTAHYSTTKRGLACFGATATVPADIAILVQGTGTAFHPSRDVSVSAELCYLAPGEYTN